MKRHHQNSIHLLVAGFLLASLAGLGLSGCSTSRPMSCEVCANKAAGREQTLLDADWLFHRGDIESNQPAATDYNDADWQRVNVPHDYVLEGTYAKTKDTKDKQVRSHAYLPYPPAWYRKHLFIPASDQGKILRLDFDGVFRDSQVWLNGQYLGRHPSGYTPFSYDITGIAKPGAENIIAVRVDPSQWEGWWYEGGGIYRHVHLMALSSLHIAQYGTYVTSTVLNGNDGADDQANVTLQTTIENNQASPANCQIVSEIIEPNGVLVQTLTNDATIPANGQAQAVQQTVMIHPQLWSPLSPMLYQLRTTVLRDGAPVDSTTTAFGIRTLHYDPDKGFSLNGQHTEIQGVACHQDFAGVGIAVPDSLQPWRVAQLKKMGCNAWRTAHNPPSIALLDACDRQGMMVMDENRHLCDAEGPKSPSGTTSTNFSEVTTMILRDRNHPSIIMWSMCNEETLQGTPEGRDLFAKMRSVVRNYDTTRPVTCAMSGGFLTNGIADAEDIVGINYNTDRYDAAHRRYPQKSLFGSEDTNEKTTRGEYATNAATGMCSCYTLSDKNWLAAEKRPFMAGTFTWTGYDYKGEPNPYGWPDVGNNTGLMDYCGFPKDKGYYFESCWSDRPMVHLLPMTWNWAGKEGQPIRVLAFSNARKVELFLNGQSLGAKQMPHDDYAKWEVPWQPGKLVAVAWTDGLAVATDTVETTTAPYRLQFCPACTHLHAHAEDAVVVRVSVLDAQGRFVPDASNHVVFSLTGDGQILGVGNGDPADHDPDKAASRNAFNGRCIAVIEAGSKPGQLKLTAQSPGLVSDAVTFDVR